MAVRHPIDEEIRERLRQLKPRQNDLAKQIGRSPAWVNKYLNGAGHATIDDLIRIIAIVIGVDPSRLTDAERQLLRAWRRIPAEKQQDVVDFVRALGRRRRPRRATQSDARSGQTTRAANSKGPGRP
jgi:transcriptional regulator with XRE-family HTH domain